MIESRPMSQRIFDETGYNMTASCKNAVLSLDVPGSTSKEDLSRILEEVGHMLSPSLKDEILSFGKKAGKLADTVDEAKEAEADIPEEDEILEDDPENPFVEEDGKTDIPEGE